MDKELESVIALIDRGDYAIAYEKLKGIAEEQLEPADQLHWNFWLGICLFENKKIEDSIKHYQKCLMISHDSGINIDEAQIKYEISLSFFSLYERKKEYAVW